MLHRIINWIAGPFKKQVNEIIATLPNVTPLTTEEKNKIKSDLIEAVKEFKKADKDKLIETVKQTLKANVEAHPFTEEVTINHEVVMTESAPKKKKRYYKKKNKKSSESTGSTSQNNVSKN